MVLFLPGRQYKTGCSRCLSNITYVQTLLENVQKIVGKDIRAICNLCRTYEANICHLCEEVLRNFTVGNMKITTKKFRNIAESPKNGPLPEKRNNEPSTKWCCTFPIKDQLFTSEPLQLKVSPIICKENKKVSEESRANLDTNSTVLKREDLSLTDIKNKIPVTLPPNKSSPLMKDSTNNKELKPRKKYIYSKKPFSNIFVDAKAATLFAAKPFVVKEKESLMKNNNKLNFDSLPKPHYNSLQIGAVSNTKQLAKNVKKKKSVTFQKCKPNIKRLPVEQSGTLPFKSEIMIHSAKTKLISKTKPYVGNKKISDISKFDEIHNLQIYKSLPKLQDTPLPPPTTLVLYYYN